MMSFSWWSIVYLWSLRCGGRNLWRRVG